MIFKGSSWMSKLDRDEIADGDDILEPENYNRMKFMMKCAVNTGAKHITKYKVTSWGLKCELTGAMLMIVGCLHGHRLR